MLSEAMASFFKPVPGTSFRRAKVNHGIKAPERQRYHGSLFAHLGIKDGDFVTMAFKHYSLVSTFKLW